MSALPPIRRLNREDFPDAPEWLDGLLYALNQFIEAVYGALGGNLSFGQNVTAQIKTVTFKTLSTYAAPWNQFYPETVSFTRALKSKAQGVVLLKIVETDSAELPVGTAINWSDEDGSIIINSVLGLTPSKSYTATFLVI